jgi:hypothetical protein
VTSVLGIVGNASYDALDLSEHFVPLEPTDGFMYILYIGRRIDAFLVN